MCAWVVVLSFHVIYAWLSNLHGFGFTQFKMIDSRIILIYLFNFNDFLSHKLEIFNDSVELDFSTDH